MRFYSILLFLFMPFLALAQSAEVKVVVKKNKNQPLSNALLAFIETSSSQKIEKRTSSNGEALFMLQGGISWKLYCEGTETQYEVKIPASSNLKQQITFTYNPEMNKKMEAQTVDRTGLNFIAQTYSSATQPDPGKTVLKVKVVSRSGVAQGRKKVVVVNHAKKEAFTAVTDYTGIAAFMVEPGAHYDIDVEEALNVSLIDVRKTPGMIVTAKVFYEAPRINEKRVGDTVLQQIQRFEPASGRAAYTVEVLNTDGQAYKDEIVYVADLNGTDVYVAYTDQNGNAQFSLPTGRKYMIHFLFEPDVDVINLTKSRGFVQGKTTVMYRPRPNLQYPESFIPKPDELFLISFNTYLGKQFPKPASNPDASLHLNWGNSFSAGTREAVLEIGYAGWQSAGRKPVNVAFVLDISGSMDGHGRLPALKESLKKLLSGMLDDDKVSLLVFESSHRLILTTDHLGSSKRQLIQAIDSLEAGGGTDMLKALSQAYQLAAANMIPGGTNQVIVLSDGYDENTVQELSKVVVAGKKGIYCQTIGVGESYNYPLLQLLADTGKGKHYHVSDDGKFNDAFLRAVENLFSPIGTNVELELVYSQPMEFTRLHGGEVKNAGSNKVIIPLADLYAGQQNLLMARFELDKVMPEIEQKPVFVTLRYKDAVTGQVKEVKADAKPEFKTKPVSDFVVLDFERRKMYAIAEVNRSLKLMAEAYAAGKNDEAEKAIAEAQKVLKSCFPDQKDKDLEKLSNDLRTYAAAMVNIKKKNSGKQKLK
ncbi:MAG: VWA domain-containing protein [Bacteroidetes bacterium]|nr:MAG: VWA domain-containing protein [Bacteroidota bacterium]